MAFELGNTALVLVPDKSAAPTHPEAFKAAAAVVARERVDTKRDLTALQRGETNERYMFCRLVHEAVVKGYTQGEAVAIVASRGELFPELVRAGHGGQSALTPGNYRSWMKKLGKHGNGRPRWDNKGALVDRYSTAVRERAGAPEWWELFNGLYLSLNGPSLAASHRMACILARKAGMGDGDFPSKRQVAHWYKQNVDPMPVAVARYGEEWVTHHMLDFVRRDWENVMAGEVWVGDHHKFDAPVRVWNEEKQAWVAVRPWLTAWLDAKSLSFVGWIIRAGADEHPDSLAIEDAFLMGTRANGNRPPLYIHTDRGKDYLSKGFAKDFVPAGTEYAHSMIREMGVQVITAIAFNARAKLVERIFGNVAGEFSKWWPGYLGRSPETRPETAMEHWTNPETLPTLQQFTEAFAIWLEDFYHNRAGGGKILDGKTPAEVWAARPELRPAMTDEELFFAFLKPYAAHLPVVSRGGTVRALGREYQSEELFRHLGKKVMIKLDRANAEHVYAFTLDGKLLCECLDCELKAIQALVRTDEDRKALSERMAECRRPLREARTVAREMAGGGKLRVISPVDRLEIAAAAPLRIGDGAEAAAIEAEPATPARPDLKRAAEAAIFGTFGVEERTLAASSARVRAALADMDQYT